MEAALREAARLRMVVDNAPIVLFAIDATGKFTLSEGRGLKVLGLEPGQVEGHSVYDLYKDEQVLVANVRRALAGEEHTAEVIVNAQGLVWETCYTPITDPTGAVVGVIGVATDITARKKAEGERRRALETREEFLAIASHELHAPLTALSLQLELARHAVELGEHANISPRLAISARQVQRLRRLVGDLVDAARLATGKLTLVPERVELGAVVREAVDRATESLEQAGCALTLETPKPVEGRWDPLRIDQLVTNLLSNVQRHAAGAPVLVRVEDAGTAARIVVSDQGCGIPAEAQPRIFERFERASRTQGLGLGLYIVKHIVDAHAGSIRLDSAPGRGTTFIVELPR